MQIINIVCIYNIHLYNQKLHKRITRIVSEVKTKPNAKKSCQAYPSLQKNMQFKAIKILF
jgi:N-acetylmuramic acid 6-phosphate (MurNAc-6-P) etherase